MRKKTSGPQGHSQSSPGGSAVHSLKGFLKTLQQRHVTATELDAFLRFRDCCDFRMQHLFANQQLNYLMDHASAPLQLEVEDVVRMHELHTFLLTVLKSRVEHDPNFKVSGDS